jgi:hypothetical protein
LAAVPIIPAPILSDWGVLYEDRSKSCFSRPPTVRALLNERLEAASNPAKLLFEVGLGEYQGGGPAVRTVVRVGHQVPAFQERGDLRG